MIGRPDPLVQRLSELDCCTLSDAMDSSGHSGAISGLAHRSGHSGIVGPALTLRLGIGQPPAGPPRHVGTTAMELAGPDNVIVVEQIAGFDAGCWGGLLSWKSGFATWPARSSMGATNVPHRAWGIRLHPGDCVTADRSGAVVIKGKCDHPSALDGRWHALCAGRPASQVMAGNYELLLKREGGE